MLRHCFGCWILLLVTTGNADGQVRVVGPGLLTTIQDDEPPLPRSMTAAEAARWTLPEITSDLKPVGTIRTPPEYARNDALLLRWGSFNSVITEITVAVTTQTADADVLLIVSGSTQQVSAAAILAAAGARMERVQFVQMSSDSVWIRDYGPRSLFVDNDRALMDHTYNRPRPLDNQIPAILAELTERPLYELPLVHGGGNFHLFDNGQAFMTSLILDENPEITADDIVSAYTEYHNLDLTLIDPFPAAYDPTQHLDMWFLPVSNNTVIIGEYDILEGDGIPRKVTEEAAELMEIRGYKVLRTPGWRADGNHYTYANSIIINEAVLLCQFSGYEVENSLAVAVFKDAFPAHVIVLIDCSDIIGFSGAIHCIVMHQAEVPDHLFGDRFDLPHR